jgi:hypothetical protein
MRGRIAAIAALAGTMVLAFSIGRAHAGGDTESCLSKTMNVTNINLDGTECQTIVGGLGPNKASAKASGLGFAEGRAENGATVKADAKENSQAICEVAAGSGSATSSGLNAAAILQVTMVGGGKAKATGPNSTAVSEISNTTGGNAQTTASGGAAAVADVESTNPGSANAVAKTGSSAVAVVEDLGGGKAKATSEGLSAAATAVAQNNCKVTSTANGANSDATAVCADSGSVITVEATKGSSAQGSDTAPPVCTPMNGGVAKVRSPMGNCG